MKPFTACPSNAKLYSQKLNILCPLHHANCDYSKKVMYQNFPRPQKLFHTELYTSYTHFKSHRVEQPIFSFFVLSYANGYVHVNQLSALAVVIIKLFC